MDGVTCDDMSGEVHIKLLSRGDTGAGGSHVLDYGRVGP